MALVLITIIKVLKLNWVFTLVIDGDYRVMSQLFLVM